MAQIINLSEKVGLHHVYLRQLRSVDLQTNRELFRSNLQRLGFLSALESALFFDYHQTEVITPLGVSQQQIPTDAIVLSAVLRAGLPFFDGFLQALPFAETAFLGAFRREESHEGVSIQYGYAACPILEGKTLILCDPMLATGSSLITCLHNLKERGQWAKLIICSVVATPEGIEKVVTSYPETTLITCSIDSHLNDKFYIVPGLGDAGDLAYGPK